jgi:hypothetical protein
MYVNTVWLKKMDSISYVYISWTIHGVWMNLKEEVLNFQIRSLERLPSVQQRQLRAKWLLYSTRSFAFVSSLKLSRRLLCSVHFVFVSTFCDGIWKFRTSFICYVDHPHTMYSSGNTDVRNWVHLLNHAVFLFGFNSNICLGQNCV